MSLTTDALLFSIILMLLAIETALPVTQDGKTFLIAGIGIAVLALLGSVIQTMIQLGAGSENENN